MYVSTPEDLNVEMSDMTWFDSPISDTEDLVIRGEKSTVRHAHPALRVFEFDDHFLYITESDDHRIYQCRDCGFYDQVRRDVDQSVLATAEQFVCGWAVAFPCMDGSHVNDQNF